VHERHAQSLDRVELATRAPVHAFPALRAQQQIRGLGDRRGDEPCGEPGVAADRVRREEVVRRVGQPERSRAQVLLAQPLERLLVREDPVVVLVREPRLREPSGHQSVVVGRPRRPVLDANAVPRDIQFLGHQRRERGVDALAHLGARGDQRHALAIDAHKGRERGGALRQVARGDVVLNPPGQIKLQVNDPDNDSPSFIAQREEDKKIVWNINGHQVDAADLAYILYQVPVLVAVHAAEMLPKTD